MKKILFSLICLAVSSSMAGAVELGNPFYISAKGDLTSTTELSFHKSHTGKDTLGNDFRVRDKYFNQRLEYGISPKVAVVGNIANTWQRNKDSNTLATGKDYHNVYWSVGALYDFYNANDAHVQAELRYLQQETQHFGGAYKAFNANAKAGYDFGYFLPYLGGEVELPIAQRKDADNDKKYGAYAGIYKAFADIVSADMKVHYGYNDFSKSRQLNGRVDLTFFITENMALSGFFDYAFFDRAKYNAQTDGHTIGALFRIKF